MFLALQASKVAAEIDAEKSAEATDSAGSVTPSKVLHLKCCSINIVCTSAASSNGCTADAKAMSAHLHYNVFVVLTLAFSLIRNIYV